MSLLLLTACNAQKALWQSGLGLSDVQLEVESLVTRGDYLAASLASADFKIDVFLPNSQECRALFVVGAKLQYREGSPGGVYQKGDQVCSAVGFGTLREWRSRRPRSGGPPIERTLANYKLVYQDDQVAFLRGRFPLAGRLGFVGFNDTIAVVPKLPECQAPIHRRNSSMEYYPAGSKVLTLVSTHGQCPITGLITPFGVGRP